MQLAFNFNNSILAAPTNTQENVDRHFNENGEEILSPKSQVKLAKIERAIRRLEMQIDYANDRFDWAAARQMRYSVESYRRQERALYL